MSINIELPTIHPLEKLSTGLNKYREKMYQSYTHTIYKPKIGDTFSIKMFNHMKDITKFTIKSFDIKTLFSYRLNVTIQFDFDKKILVDAELWLDPETYSPRSVFLPKTNEKYNIISQEGGKRNTKKNRNRKRKSKTIRRR